MGMIGLIVGSLVAGSGLLALMTWLETSLLTSLAPAHGEPEQQAPFGTDLGRRTEPASVPG